MAVFPPEKYELLGTMISRVNLDSATQAIFRAVEEKRKGYVTVTGVHGVIEAHSDPVLRGVQNASFLTTPDGMPTVWCGHARGFTEMGRVYGPDLMFEVMKGSAARGVRHFLYGGREGVADLLKSKMEDRFLGVQIVGSYCPPFRPLTPEEVGHLQSAIQESKPDILWVGLSTPKQEQFMGEYLRKLDVTLMVGVGAAFDFHAGIVTQAPRWIQRSGLEWTFRLCTDPRRLWKRYSTIVPQFLRLAWRDFLRGFFVARLPPAKLGATLLHGSFLAFIAGGLCLLLGLWLRRFDLAVGMLAGLLFTACSASFAMLHCEMDARPPIHYSPYLLWLISLTGVAMACIGVVATLFGAGSRLVWVGLTIGGGSAAISPFLFSAAAWAANRVALKDQVDSHEK